MSVRTTRWILVLFVCGVRTSCGDDSAGDGGTGVSSAVDGGPGPPLSDSGGGGSCIDDSDCGAFACCSCDPVDTPPNCDGLGCAEPDCIGITAVCGANGQCEAVLANCDPATVSCEATEPPCQGFVPLVQDGCWTGDCVPMENCDLDCEGGRCPWLCPQGGDTVTVGQGDSELVTLRSDLEGREYSCMLVFDHDEDTYDCAAQLIEGTQLTVTEGVVPGTACTEGASLTISTGTPEQCAFSCTLGATG